MASVIHIAEIAALLTLAYVVGWTLGYLARRLVAGMTKPAVAIIPAERLAAATGDSTDALVKAPIIVPVASDPPPPVPQPAMAIAAEPLPESVVTAEPVVVPEPVMVSEPAMVLDPIVVPEPKPEPATLAEPAVEPSLEAPIDPAPAPIVEPPVEIKILIPEVATLPPLRIEPVVPAPKPMPAPPPEPEPQPVAAFTAAPALQPGVAWAGVIRGHEAPRFEVPVTADPVPSAPEPVIIETDAAPAAPEPPLPVAEPSPPPRAAIAEHDEDAAMRAIEGGWSRVRAPSMPGAPELADVGAAVAAAQTAVEQVLAQAGIDPQASLPNGKPKGLLRPRPSGKDNLRQINGLGALDESTLNNLGVFHFDQIANWDETQVAWMESHVFARGRIGRENWQQQARDLAAAPAA